jgi:hypothetical protein
MKVFLKPIVNSPSSLSNRVLIRNSSYLSNNSEYSLNNNSSTTNASAIRKKPIFLPKLNTKSGQILKNVNFDFFKRNNNLMSMTPSIKSTRISKAYNDLFDKADKIMKDRMNKHGDFIGNKKHTRSLAISISKGISQKNYTINLLKEQRTKINEKERIIDEVVKEFSTQFENDYKRFIDFVSNEKRKQQLEEEAMNEIKEKKEKKKEILLEESLLNKRLEESIERKIREIFLLKSYGSFLHQVFDKKFSFDEINNANSRTKNLDKIVSELISIYETKNKYEEIPKELNDVELLIKTYILYEDRILMALKNKDMALKDITKQKKIYEREIQQIKLSLIDYENDFKNIKYERNNVNIEMKNYKLSETDSLENILLCIIELGQDIGTDCPIPTAMDKDHLSDYTIYAKKTLANLKSQEVLVNDLINEIENTVEYGSLMEKQIMERCIGEQKKINKKEKQLKIKMLQEELKNQKNLRALKRANKVVITGRQAPMIVNMKNIKHKTIKKLYEAQKEQKENIYDIGGNDDDDESEEK